MPSRNVQLLFALFASSGFTGLIYESVWSHYLKVSSGMPHTPAPMEEDNACACQRAGARS